MAAARALRLLKSETLMKLRRDNRAIILKKLLVIGFEFKMYFIYILKSSNNYTNYITKCQVKIS